MFNKLRSTDTVLVLSAVLIAYFIWLIAKTGNVEEQIVDDVAVAVDLPPNIEAEPSRKTVSIEVQYPKSLRREIHSGAFRVVIRDPNLFSQAGIREAQSATVPLLPMDVQSPSLPQTVRIQKVEPGRITVMVKFRTAPVRIVPSLVGQPASGYRLEKTIVNLTAPLLIGPQDRLDDLPRNSFSVVELQTSPIFLTDQRDSFSTSALILVPEQLKLVDENERQRPPRDISFTLVQVIIKEEDTSRTIEGIPIQIATVTRNLVARTEPTSATVTIYGPRSRVESLDPRVILLRPKNPPEEKSGFVGKIAIEPRLDDTAPPNVSVVSVRPNTILLRYETLPSDTTTSPIAVPKD